MKSRFSFIILIFIIIWASYDVYLSMSSVKRSLCSTALIELMGRKVTPRQTLNSLYAQVGGQLTHVQCQWSILWKQRNDDFQTLSNQSSIPLRMTQDDIREDLYVIWNIAPKTKGHPLMTLWNQNYNSYQSSNLKKTDFKAYDQPKSDQVKLGMDRWQRLCFSLSSEPILTIKDHSKSRQPFYCFPH